MAIKFHEGLPGSGKSYEAVVKQIIPKLQAGRKVFANIKGLDHEKIASVSGLAVERVRELLHQIEWDDTKKIYALVENDSYVVIDELQDFWPSNQKPLSPEMTEFITQHRHRGLDILCMGQVLKDCHKTWRGRVQDKIVFLNKEAVGMPTKYKWEAQKQVKPDTWQTISSGGGEYEKKYFGTYASHVQDVENKEMDRDSRTNLFNVKSLRYGLPFAVIAALFAVNYLWGFFHGKASPVHMPPAHVAAKPQHPQAMAGPVTAQAVQPSSLPQPQPEKPPAPAVEETDPVLVLIKQTRPRLAGVLQGKFHGKPVLLGQVQFLDNATHKQDVFRFDQLEDLGWNVRVKSYGVDLVKGEKIIIVTSWPVDPFGSVAEESRASSHISGGPAGT